MEFVKGKIGFPSWKWGKMIALFTHGYTVLATPNPHVTGKSLKKNNQERVVIVHIICKGKYKK